MSEYTHVADQLGETVGGLGDDYADFVAGDVINVIEASYGEPTVRGVMGSSLGGLIAFHMAQRHPDLFHFAASLSGTFGWGSIGSSDPDADTLIRRFTGAGTQDTVFYLDSGGSEGSGCADADGDGVADDGDDSDNYCVTRQLADLLDAEGYEFTMTLHHWWEPDAPHNEVAWAARAFRALDVFEGL
jgi:pimeloyl-ACP methyl ester carboxylesterase